MFDVIEAVVDVEFQLRDNPHTFANSPAQVAPDGFGVHLYFAKDFVGKFRGENAQVDAGNPHVFGHPHNGNANQFSLVFCFV